MKMINLMRSTLVLSILIALPLSSMATVNYVVKRGDSLWSVAAQHRPTPHVSVHETIRAIQAMNGPLMQDSSSIQVGQNLVLPSTLAELKSALSPQAPVSVPEPGNANINTNIVQAPSTQQIAQQALGPVPLSISQSPAQSAVQSPSSAASSAANFPWGWSLIIVILLALAYLLWHRKWQGVFPEEIKRLAALRLGISSRRQEPVITRYKTRHFKEALSTEQNFQEINPESKFSHASAEAMASAMIDMAEMNYDGAERLLQNAISQDPENLDLRLKLLELYMTTDNRAAFKLEAEYVEQKVPENSPIWHQVRGMYLNQWAYDAN